MMLLSHKVEIRVNPVYKAAKLLTTPRFVLPLTSLPWANPGQPIIKLGVVHDNVMLSDTQFWRSEVSTEGIRELAELIRIGALDVRDGGCRLEPWEIDSAFSRATISGDSDILDYRRGWGFDVTRNITSVGAGNYEDWQILNTSATSSWDDHDTTNAEDYKSTITINSATNWTTASSAPARFLSGTDKPCYIRGYVTHDPSANNEYIGVAFWDGNDWIKLVKGQFSGTKKIQMSGTVSGSNTVYGSQPTFTDSNVHLRLRRKGKAIIGEYRAEGSWDWITVAEIPASWNADETIRPGIVTGGGVTSAQMTISEVYFRQLMALA